MVPDPCVDLQCINSTDTCSGGKCYCGSSSSLICDKRSQFPLCLNGSCVCSKTRNQYEKGDGKSQGSCKSNLHKCQPDGKCAECTYDSECSGLSNRCINRICVFKVLLCLNDFSQTLHFAFFSTMWTRWWDLKELECLNVALQLLQLKGLLSK